MWFELLADPVSTWRETRTALPKLGVRLQHEVKRFLTGSCNEVERTNSPPPEDAKPDDVDIEVAPSVVVVSVDIVLEVIKGGEARGIGAGSEGISNSGDEAIVPHARELVGRPVMPGVDLTTLPIGTWGK